MPLVLGRAAASCSCAICSPLLADRLWCRLLALLVVLALDGVVVPVGLLFLTDNSVTGESWLF